MPGLCNDAKSGRAVREAASAARMAWKKLNHSMNSKPTDFSELSLDMIIFGSTGDLAVRKLLLALSWPTFTAIFRTIRELSH